MSAKNPHAVELGRLGGRSKSPAKLAALRANAKRPRPNAKGRPLGAKDTHPRKTRKQAT